MLYQKSDFEYVDSYLRKAATTRGAGQATTWRGTSYAEATEWFAINNVGIDRELAVARFLTFFGVAVF